MDKIDKGMQDMRVKLTQEMQRRNIAPLFCIVADKDNGIKLISVINNEEEEFRIIENIYTELKKKRTTKTHIN